MRFLALKDEKGRLMWISAARPGRTHDIPAARYDHILAHLRAARLGALADTRPEGSQPCPRRTGRTRLRTPQEQAGS
ncbi:hypothetical protein [Streptomyces sp. T028]|uniref:hypothetical protein n=1 Tax=Streptomyces sp. T028 TaxID=3394379 RepID=UPI003A84B7AA